MNYTSQEIKSGLFIVVSLCVLLVLTFIVGDFAKGGASTWKIRFGYVSGLEDNAPVYFAGHEVGKVDKIEVVASDRLPIHITVKIADHVVLRKDTKAYIDTLGLMGEKFIELTPGSIEQPPLAEGSVIIGNDPIPMYQVVQKMDLLADRMEELTANLNPVMDNVAVLLDGNKEQISLTIANFEQTSANLRDMTNDLKHRPWRLLRKG